MAMTVHQICSRVTTLTSILQSHIKNNKTLKVLNELNKCKDNLDIYIIKLRFLKDFSIA